MPRRKKYRYAHLNRARPKAQNFGLAIRHWRERLGLSIDQAASRAGMVKTHWHHYERGSKIPRADTWCRIADALGVDVGELRPRPPEGPGR